MREWMRMKLLELEEERGDTIEIRRFRPGDEKKCGFLKESFRLYLSMRGSDWLAESISPEGILKALDDGMTLVADDQGVLCGYLHLSISAYGVGCITACGVCRDRQHKGIGKRLVSEVESEARKLGLRKIWLMVGLINRPGIDFYLSNGYAPEGLFRDMVIEGMDSLALSKHLWH